MRECVTCVGGKVILEVGELQNCGSLQLLPFGRWCGGVEVVGVALRSPDIVFAGALAPFFSTWHFTYL